MFDAFKVGEKWTTVIPSTIDVDFFDSVQVIAIANYHFTAYETTKWQIFELSHSFNHMDFW